MADRKHGGNTAAADPMRLLTVKELSEYLQVSVQTLYVWRSKRTGPAGARVGKHTRYRQADVDAWLEAQKQAS